MLRHYIAPLLTLVLALGLAACGGGPRQPVGLMDTPLHHLNQGSRLLDAGEPAKALREFDAALQLDPDQVSAQAGKGVALILLRQADSGRDLLDQAESAADSDAERLDLAVWRLRSLAALSRVGKLSGPALLRDMQAPLRRGLKLDERHAPLHFHAGEAALRGLDFPAAQGHYTRVLHLGGEYAERARKRLELMAKVQRAQPGSAVGREVALVESLTRADMAALLVEELGAAKLYARTTLPPAPAFAPPDAEKKPRYQESGPPDIGGHPLRGDIEQVLALGVKGLERYPDGTFRPAAALTRAEAAMIWEDVILRATGDAGLATRFLGGASPFADLASDHPAFNAAVLVVTRGVMEADSRLGVFDPLGPVPGADALVSVKRLRDELGLF